MRTRFRLPLVLAFFEVETFAYLVVNRISSRLPSRSLLTESDEQIPLRHHSLWLYLSFVPYCVLTSYDLGGLRRIIPTFGSVFVNSVTAYRSFLRHPSAYPRPPASHVVNARLRGSFEALHSVDRASNTFPSLHVSHTVLLALALSTHIPRDHADVYLTWAMAVSVSTLLVKQHYLVDVTSGIVVAERIVEDVYAPWIAGKLSKRETVRRVRRLCRELDAMVQPPLVERRLTLHDRHPLLRDWLLRYQDAGGFAQMYLSCSGRHEFFRRKDELVTLLDRIQWPLAAANYLMPGWLQFLNDFRNSAPDVGDATLLGYLRSLDEDLHSVMQRLFELEPQVVSQPLRPESSSPRLEPSYAT